MDLKFDWGFNQDSKHFVRVCSWVSKKHNNKQKSGASPSEWAPLLCLNGWLLNCSTNKIILLWQIFWALLTEALSVSLTFKTRTHLCFLLLFYMKTTSPFLHFKQKTTFTALISSYQRCTHVNNYWTSSANHLMSFEKSFPESLSFVLMQYLEKKKKHNSSACSVPERSSVSILTLDSRFQVAGISRLKQLQGCQAVMWNEVWHAAVFHLHEHRELKLDHSAILIYIYFISVVVLEMSRDSNGTSSNHM